MTCSGSGAPTIVLEAGWAADHLVWATVQAELARVTRTCSYDRAGTGQSPPGPLPRSAEAVSRDLLRALKSAGIDDDLVIVGHSIGAVYARETERLAGGRVVGLVLVDPTVEAMAPEGLAPFIANATACLVEVGSGRRLSQEGDRARCRVRPTEDPVATWSHRVSELEHLFQPGAIGAPSRAQVRVEILSAGNDSETLSGKWRIAHHEILARTYRLGRHRVVAGSGHMMMRDAPASIVEATLEIVMATRARSALP
jgi:pimeloyl-ACP methyl ester carboxylesterase